MVELSITKASRGTSFQLLSGVIVILHSAKAAFRFDMHRNDVGHAYIHEYIHADDAKKVIYIYALPLIWVIYIYGHACMLTMHIYALPFIWDMRYATIYIRQRGGQVSPRSHTAVQTYGFGN